MSFACDENYLGENEKIALFKKEWASLQKESTFLPWGVSEFEYKLFINPITYDKKVSGINPKSPLRIYPNLLKQYQAHQKARDYLNSIPREKFHLDMKLIKKVHEIAMKGAYRWEERLGAKVLPRGIGVAGLGKIKGHFNFGFSPLTREPITKSTLEGFKNNPLVKFWELPFPLSKPNAHRGLIIFPGRKKAREELKKLITWYHQNEKSMNPIELAAVFQRRLVSIHPFYNGNGRVSRLFMNKILEMNGLPPSTVSNFKMDLYSPTEKDWVLEVERGLRRSIELRAMGKQEGLLFTPPYEGSQVSIQNEGSQVGIQTNHLMDSPKFHLRLQRLKGREYFFQGERFHIRVDGFLYNDLNIPHVLENGVLYPISDMSYMFYNKVCMFSLRECSFLRGEKKIISPEHKKVLEKHILLLNQINFGRKIDIKVASYEEIQKANSSLSPYFYPWQKELLKTVFFLNRKEGIENLNLNRSPHPHHFGDLPWRDEVDFYKETSHIIAMYQYHYLEYKQLEPIIKKDFKDLHSDYLSFQRRLFRLAKKEIEIRLPQIRKSSRVKKESIERLFTYLRHTPLHYKSFEEAESFLGNSVYLLRSDTDMSQKIGFVPEKMIRKLYDQTPFAGAIVKILSRYIPAFKAYWKSRPHLLNYTKFEIASRPELKKMYNVLLSQASGKSEDKVYISMSTNIELYDYASFEDNNPGEKPYSLFLVKLPIDKVRVNYKNYFNTEYEVLALDYVFPFQVKKKLRDFTWK